ncbi:MAG: phosphoglycerate kinase [Phycisphaerae bacterium]|nr:phosphoglycerate kinase [Phycisphaerae bacterium]
MAKKSVRDLDVAGRRVLIRADLNVPLDDNQAVSDDRRIRMFLPTLEYVVEMGGKAIVMSHLGRPKGDPAVDAKLSLAPVAKRMAQLLDQPVHFVGQIMGPDVEKAVSDMTDGDVLLLENLRFDPAETVIDKAKKNPDGKLTPEQDAVRVAFGEGLAALGDVYVNDAFGTCHRKHVSMYDVPVLLGAGNRAVGFLVDKELEYLGKALESPKRPFLAVLGGAKVSDKINVIKNLLTKVDHVLIGGAMTFTFWAAQGKKIGKSLCEPDKLDLARELIAEGGAKLHLPVDSVAATELASGVATQTIEGDLPDDLMGLDVGPKTLAQYSDLIIQAKTIVWNGPVGAFEHEPFHRGTYALAEKIAQASDNGAVTVIGGGDSAAAVEQAGLAKRMTHISTGGGASLKFLEGKKFDPIEIIDDV